MIRNLLQDIRYGARMLARSPGFTAVAVITLSLGIGANTAIFSVVNAVLLNPFPYKDHSRLVLIRHSLPKVGIAEQIRSSGPEFYDYKSHSEVFEQVAAWEPVSRILLFCRHTASCGPALRSHSDRSDNLCGRAPVPDSRGRGGLLHPRAQGGKKWRRLSLRIMSATSPRAGRQGSTPSLR